MTPYTYFSARAINLETCKPDAMPYFRELCILWLSQSDLNGSPLPPREVTVSVRSLQPHLMCARSTYSFLLYRQDQQYLKNVGCGVLLPTGLD